MKKILLTTIILITLLSSTCLAANAPKLITNLEKNLEYPDFLIPFVESQYPYWIDSAYDAKRKYGVHPSSINRACKKGGRANGYHWRFITDNSQANTEITIETKESIAS